MNYLNSINNFLENIFDIIRSCANCGHIHTKEKTMLCSHCYFEILKYYSEKQNYISYKDQQILTYSLFNWKPGASNALSSLMTCLKGRSPEDVWLFYAIEFIQKRIGLSSIPKNSILTPCPNSKKIEDHAFQFCQALSKITGIQMKVIFTSESQTHFRHQNRSLRELDMNTRLSWSEKFTKSEFREQHIIFVDDIITTGTTVKSAYIHSLHCQSFEAWSLSYRTLL